MLLLFILNLSSHFFSHFISVLYSLQNIFKIINKYYISLLNYIHVGLDVDAMLKIISYSEKAYFNRKFIYFIVIKYFLHEYFIRHLLTFY